MAHGPQQTAATGRPPSHGWAVVTTALLVFLVLVAFERTFAMVFVLNFTTAGPGPTVLLIGLLLSGFLYPLGLRRFWPHPVPFLDLLVVFGSNLVLLSLIPHPTMAALASLLAFTVLTPVLFTLVSCLRARFADGMVLGLLLHLAGRAWLDTAPFSAVASGWTWTLVAAIAFFALWILFVRPLLLTLTPDGLRPPRPHLVTPFLFLAYGFLGSPIIVALWLGTPLLPTWGAATAGCLLGLVSLRLPPPSPLALFASGVVFLVSLAAVLLFGAAVYVAYPLALATAVHLVGSDLRRIGRGTLRAVGIETGVLQAIALIALFLHAVAPSWAFLPPPLGSITQGRAPVYLIAIGTIVMAALLLVPAFREPAASLPRSPRLPERPFVLAVSLSVVVAAGGLWVHEEVPPPAAPTMQFRVATYNVHQYFSSEQTGHYNLEAVAAVIRESGADVIGLQESEGARMTSGNVDGVRWLAHRLDMHYAYGPPTATQIYGISLLSRYPIVDVAWIDLPARESVERAAMRAILETPLGPVPVVVTHLQTFEFVADRVAQVERLVAWTQPLDRAWILGDFNTPPDPKDPAYRRMTENFTDAWTDSGRGLEEGPTALDAKKEERIDHIYLKGQWTARDCRTYGGAMASDHRLVVCEITPPGARGWTGYVP